MGKDLVASCTFLASSSDDAFISLCSSFYDIIDPVTGSLIYFMHYGALTFSGDW
jgi:hypothetical protein